MSRVLVVNTTDRAGGAEHSARTILDGFEALGTETHLVVGTKLTDDPRVIPLEASPHLDYRPGSGARERAIAKRCLRTEGGLAWRASNIHTAGGRLSSLAPSPTSSS